MNFGLKKKDHYSIKELKKINVEIILYFLDVPIDELRMLVQKRNAKLDEKTFNITSRWFNKWLPLFEAQKKLKKPIVLSTTSKFPSASQFLQ